MTFFVFSRESLKATDTLLSSYWCPGFSSKGGNKKKSRQLDGMVLYITKLIDFEECLQTKLSSTIIHLIANVHCLFISNEFSTVFDSTCSLMLYTSRVNEAAWQISIEKPQGDHSPRVCFAVWSQWLFLLFIFNSLANLLAPVVQTLDSALSTG